MREIGIRELKANLSRTLRSVSAGETVRVTTRGQVVAEIVPADGSRRAGRLEALIADGRVSAPLRDRPRRAPKLVRSRSASELILAERDAER